MTNDHQKSQLTIIDQQTSQLRELTTDKTSN